MKYKNDHLKNIEDEYESKFKDRKTDKEEMEKYINKKLGELPIHQFLQHLSLNDFLWDFDAVLFYPSAVSDDKSIYRRIETCYVFTPDKNYDLVE